MTIITRKRADQYAIVPNAVANDERLTFEERGVLVYLLAKPHDWNVSVANLQNVGGIGRDKVYRILKKLAEIGYITRTRVVDEKQRVVRYDYDVHDEAVPERLPLPLPENPRQAQPHPENQEQAKPLPEKPVTGKPVPENQDTYKEPIEQNIPPNPLDGGSIDLGFERLCAAWRADKIGDRTAAYRAFGALTEAERSRADACAKTALWAWRARKARTPRLSTYLSERRFEEFYDAPEIDKDGDFIITPRRPEWGAWLGNIRSRLGENGVQSVVRYGRYVTPRRWPDGEKRASA